MASPNFEGGRPTEQAMELIRLLEQALRNSRAIDREALCIQAGRKVSGCRAFKPPVQHAVRPSAWRTPA